MDDFNLAKMAQNMQTNITTNSGIGKFNKPLFYGFPSFNPFLTN
jgi:hypothetical protein